MDGGGDPTALDPAAAKKERRGFIVPAAAAVGDAGVAAVEAAAIECEADAAAPLAMMPDPAATCMRPRPAEDGRAPVAAGVNGDAALIVLRINHNQPTSERATRGACGLRRRVLQSLSPPFASFSPVRPFAFPRLLLLAASSGALRGVRRPTPRLAHRVAQGKGNPTAA